MARAELALCALAAALALAACAGGPPEPVPIVLDEDACSHCRMAISEREYAAELVTREGQVERFDDIGCLAAWLREHGRPAGAAAFVTDYRSGEWLAAEAAVYVAAPALPTPMGSGLAAFAERAAAEAASAELGGATAEWEAVRSGAVGDVTGGEAGP
jgi:copper chaperone NosL